MPDNKQEMNIQWYPGHMTKTRRMIQSQLKNMDAVCEILDARIPLSSRNPDMEELTAGKPRLIVLNRIDVADSAATRIWSAWFRARGAAVLEVNAKERHEDYFNAFFADGGPWKEYCSLKEKRIFSTDYARTDTQSLCQTTVCVYRNQLRQRLIQDGIIK